MLDLALGSFAYIESGVGSAPPGAEATNKQF